MKKSRKKNRLLLLLILLIIVIVIALVVYFKVFRKNSKDTDVLDTVSESGEATSDESANEPAETTDENSSTEENSENKEESNVSIDEAKLDLLSDEDDKLFEENGDPILFKIEFHEALCNLHNALISDSKGREDLINKETAKLDQYMKDFSKYEEKLNEIESEDSFKENWKNYFNEAKKIYEKYKSNDYDASQGIILDNTIHDLYNK